MFDYLVMFVEQAQQAGLDTETLRKSNDGLQCLIHRELVEAGMFNMLLILAMMSGKPFSFATHEQIDILMLTPNWVQE
jgi:hypothetical protein